MMEPTIKTDKYELWLGDCLEIMPLLEPQSVDAVICDPPYGTTACAWDSVIPFDAMWSGIKGVAKERAAIALFGSQPFTSALIMSNPKMFKYCWIWKKSKAANFASVKYQPQKIHEDICVFGEGDSYNPLMTAGRNRKKGGYHSIGDVAVISGAPSIINDQYYPKSILDFSNAGNHDAGLHPTQKPVPLFSYLVKTYTNERETVLDFTMGSGTTGVACIKNNRYLIGIEKEEKYFEIAAKRLEQCASQQMFDFSEASCQ